MAVSFYSNFCWIDDPFADTTEMEYDLALQVEVQVWQ